MLSNKKLGCANKISLNISLVEAPNLKCCCLSVSEDIIMWFIMWSHHVSVRERIEAGCVSLNVSSHQKQSAVIYC